MTPTLTAPLRAPRAQPAGTARQKLDFRSGNEAAAVAARDIGFHVMGYFPITPSTEVAEQLSKMQADEEHDILMIAGDGDGTREVAAAHTFGLSRQRANGCDDGP